ncbi:hypothetical protein ACKKBG_A29150 [Auxenochlorella protothecoides x Auxenochlorella symbiontica]
MPVVCSATPAKGAETSARHPTPMSWAGLASPFCLKQEDLSMSDDEESLCTEIYSDLCPQLCLAHAVALVLADEWDAQEEVDTSFLPPDTGLSIQAAEDGAIVFVVKPGPSNGMRVCYGLEGFPDVHCVFSAPEGVLAGRLPLCKAFVSELQRWMEHLKKQRLEEYFDELNVLLRTSSTASSGLHWEESWARLNN